MWNHLSVFPLPEDHHTRHDQHPSSSHHSHHSSSPQAALPQPLSSSGDTAHIHALPHSLSQNGTSAHTSPQQTPNSGLSVNSLSGSNLNQGQGSNVLAIQPPQPHQQLQQQQNPPWPGAETFGSSPWQAAGSKSHNRSQTGNDSDRLLLRIQLRDVEPLPPDDNLGYALLDVGRCVPQPGSSWEQWVTLKVGGFGRNASRGRDIVCSWRPAPLLEARHFRKLTTVLQKQTCLYSV